VILDNVPIPPLPGHTIKIGFESVKYLDADNVCRYRILVVGRGDELQARHKLRRSWKTLAQMRYTKADVADVINDLCGSIAACERDCKSPGDEG